MTRVDYEYPGVPHYDVTLPPQVAASLFRQALKRLSDPLPDGPPDFTVTIAAGAS